jgi:hypothetical protein
MKWNKLIQNIAGDIVAFVGDLRVAGYSVEQAWAIAHQVVSRLQYLKLQDAPQKRQPPVRLAGAWAGPVFKTTEVIQSVSQDKWEKAQAQIGEITEGFKQIRSGTTKDFDYKQL